MDKSKILALRRAVLEKDFARMNDRQKQAVFTVNGPLLILAGAGSGKTTVLINRIANILRHAGADVARQQLFVEGIHSGRHGSGLHQNIRAVGIVFHHPANPAYLPFDSIQPMDKLRILLRCSFFFALRTAAALFRFHAQHLFRFAYPIWVF